MVTFLFITLVCSCAGLVVLIGVKRYEIKRGRVIMAGIRPRIGAAAHAGVMFVESVLPALALRALGRMAGGIRTLARRALAQGIVLFEHTLHGMLAFVHNMTRPPQAGGPASAFLQEVAQHKRALQKRAPSKRVIVDDN